MEMSSILETSYQEMLPLLLFYQTDQVRCRTTGISCQLIRHDLLVICFVIMEDTRLLHSLCLVVIRLSVGMRQGLLLAGGTNCVIG